MAEVTPESSPRPQAAEPEQAHTSGPQEEALEAIRAGLIDQLARTAADTPWADQECVWIDRYIERARTLSPEAFADAVRRLTGSDAPLTAALAPAVIAQFEPFLRRWVQGDFEPEQLHRRVPALALPGLGEALALFSRPDTAPTEDGDLLVASDPGPGQTTVAAFVAGLRARLHHAVDEELEGTGLSSEGCPYLDPWLDRLQTVSPQYGERFLQRWAHPEETSLEAWTDAVEAEVRLRTQAWRQTGEVDLPHAPDTPGGQPQIAADSGTAPAQAPLQARAAMGEGRPLDGNARTRLESGFGTSLHDVRVHTGGEAAGVARSQRAAAVAVGSNIAFAPGAYRPNTPLGDLLIAHEVAHTLQQRGAGPSGSSKALESDADQAALGALGGAGRPRLGGGLALASCDIMEDFAVDNADPAEERDKIAAALASDSAQQAIDVYLPGQATEDERIQLLQLVVDADLAGSSDRSQRMVVDTWRSFDDVLTVAGANPELWRSCVSQGVDLDPVVEETTIADTFRADTVAKAHEHIDNNKVALAGGMSDLGIAADGTVGPETQAIRRERERIQLLANDILRVRQTLDAFRTLQVGWNGSYRPSSASNNAIIRDEYTGRVTAARFDPARVPEFHADGHRDEAHFAGQIGRRSGYPDSLPQAQRTGQNVRTYSEVKAQHDLVLGVLSALTASDPVAFALARSDHIDTAAAGGDFRATVASDGLSMAAALDDVRGRIPSDIDDRDLKPIHESFLVGGATAASGTDWDGNPAANQAARAMLSSYDSTQFWTTIGLAVVSVIGLVVAEFATAGTATFFIAGGAATLAIGADVARSWEQWDDLSDAASANTQSGALVNQGQVDGALLQAVLTTAFALFDVADLARLVTAPSRRGLQATLRQAAGDAPTPPAPRPDAPTPTTPAPDAPATPSPTPDAPTPTTPSPDGPTPTTPSPTPDAPTPTPTPPTPSPTWTLPSSAVVDPSVGRAQLQTALQGVDAGLRAQIVGSTALQRGLARAGYVIDDLAQAWAEWGRRSADLTSDTFPDYVARLRGISTAGTARSSTPIANFFGQAWSGMTHIPRVRALFEHTLPGIHRALADGTLSPDLAARIRAILASPPTNLTNRATTVEGASSHFVEGMSELLGRAARTPDELAELAGLVSSGSKGSLGEWFSFHHLLDDAARAVATRHPRFSQADIPGLTVNPFVPDQLHAAARQTVDLKTGYHTTRVEPSQIRDYDTLVDASRTTASVARRVGGTVNDAGRVTQGLRRHTWLFQPSTQQTVRYLGQTMEASRAAAVRMYRQLSGMGLNTPQVVYYLGRDGNIYRVLGVSGENVVSTRQVGTRITDILTDVP